MRTLAAICAAGEAVHRIERARQRHVDGIDQLVQRQPARRQQLERPLEPVGVVTERARDDRAR